MFDFLQRFADARRVFQYDYIVFDAIFLLIWILFLIRNKKFQALTFGLIIAPIIYFIDAVVWWNTPAGSNFPIGTFIREYWIGGIQMPHPLGQYFFLKFGADFMMTISYAIFAFPWIWIMFESIKKTIVDMKQILKFTSVYLVIWVLTPLFSALFPIDDTIVNVVRHMHSQIIFMVLNVIIGYSVLSVVYRKELNKVVRIFFIGVLASLIMELPLYLFHIRPTGLRFILFESLFLLNQGVPYLYLVWDKILPKIKLRFFTKTLKHANPSN